MVLFALLLLLPPLLLTFQKFVAFVTFGERSHQLLARLTEDSLLFHPVLCLSLFWTAASSRTESLKSCTQSFISSLE